MATVTLTGKRNYTGTASRTFYVSSAALYVSTSGDDNAFGVSVDSPKRTLQAAITAAYDGAVVHVGDGVYGPVSTANKAIQIVSDNGHEKTVIDGGESNRCVYVGNGSGYTATVFKGFTIRNGRVSGNGAGACGGRFDNCVIENCRSTSSYYGGGTYYSILNNCLVKGNSAYYGGGTAYGTLVNCTVVGNTTSYRGGGTYNGTIRNSIVWDNNGTGNSYSNYYSGTFTYSCTAPSVSGTGNRCIEPYFTDPSNSDWRLRQYSPCLDVGDNSYVVGVSDLSGRIA